MPTVQVADYAFCSNSDSRQIKDEGRQCNSVGTSQCQYVINSAYFIQVRLISNIPEHKSRKFQEGF